MTSKHEKKLPVTDLLLIPKRKAEKKEMLKKAHKEEAGDGHVKVKGPGEGGIFGFTW